MSGTIDFTEHFARLERRHLHRQAKRLDPDRTFRLRIVIGDDGNGFPARSRDMYTSDGWAAGNAYDRLVKVAKAWEAKEYEGCPWWVECVMVIRTDTNEGA